VVKNERRERKLSRNKKIGSFRQRENQLPVCQPGRDQNNRLVYPKLLGKLDGSTNKLLNEIGLSRDVSLIINVTYGYTVPCFL